MGNGPSQLITDFLTDGAPANATSAQIADRVAAGWSRIDASLVPIIGVLGVAALFKRAVHLTAQAHGWLAATTNGIQLPIDMDALRATIARRTSADARAAGVNFLQTFNHLLNGLIGPSLTEILLLSAWQPS